MYMAVTDPIGPPMRSLTEPLERAFLPEGDRDLPARFYQGLCLIGGVLAALVLIPLEFLLHRPVVVGVAALSFALLAFVLYAAARRGYYFYTLLFVLLLVTLNVLWFPNAGVAGSGGFYFFPAVLYPLVFFEKRWRRALGLLVVANYLALVWIDRAFPGVATPFLSDRERAVDLASGFVVSSIASGLILWVVITGYRGERQRLKTTVQALDESRAQLARIFQLNPDAVYIIDPAARRFLDVNEGFERLSGWTRAEAVGRNGLDLELWVDPDQRVTLYERFQTDGRVDAFRSRFRRRDGGEFWGSTSAAPIEVGGRTCLLMTTRDVTGQIGAEQAVVESRAMLFALIDSSDDLVWLVDPATHAIVLFNTAFAAYVRNDQAVELRPGMLPRDVLPPDAADQWIEFYTRAVVEGPFTLEYTTRSKHRTFLLSFNPVRAGGDLLGVSVFGKDITEHKRAEEARDRMELQLVEAQKMESLGSLAGGVAHDFNNMLGGIMGYADLLLSDESSPARRTQLEAILHAATRSSELTRKLLAFARRGKNIVEAIEVRGIVRESVAMLRPSLRPDVGLELDLREAWSIDGDPSQLSQMIVNLCINANEAMRDGGTLTIRTADVDVDADAGRARNLPAGEYVELTVEDSGVGMSDEVKARAFEPFFTTKVGGEITGTGLGLATVYGIVHLHRGTVGIESAPGQGTAFTILLPRGTLARTARAAPVGAQPGEGLILVVEDEELLRDFTRAALKRLGYRTLAAADGVDGVRVFLEHHGELAAVILDLKMPRKGGRETFLEIREIDPGVPVLICSGFGDNEEAQGLITLGAKGLLPKPFRLSELSDRLGAMIRT